MNKIGIDFPVQHSTQDGYFRMAYDTYVELDNNIRNFLLTNYGERLGRYNFGANLKALLFEPANDETATIIRNNITSGLGKWFPFINILSLDIKFFKATEERNSIEVTLRYKIKGAVGIEQTLQQVI